MMEILKKMKQKNKCCWLNQVNYKKRKRKTNKSHFNKSERNLLKLSNTLTKDMKYQEFKELILKIDVKNIEVEGISGLELEKMVEHLHNLAQTFEINFGFECSDDYLAAKKK